MVKILPRGYMVRLACSGRSKVWLEYGENISGTNVKTTHDLEKQIFEGKITESVEKFNHFLKSSVCHKPDPGTTMTFAYFHLPPFVNVSSDGWGGIEPNFNKEFAKKYDLKMEWFDAKYSWGKFVPETGR